MLNRWVYFVFIMIVAGTSQASVISGITNHVVSGEGMFGMLIGINGAPGIEWDGNNGGLSYENLGDDTFVGTWRYTNQTGAEVTELILDASGASAVFDFMDDEIPGSVSTPGSENGAFEIFDNGPASQTAIVTFVDLISVAPNAAVGDLSRLLTLNFSANPLPDGESIFFEIDTDMVQFVPLPPAVLFFASGLLALLNFTNRKRIS